MNTGTVAVPTYLGILPVNTKLWKTCLCHSKNGLIFSVGTVPRYQGTVPFFFYALFKGLRNQRLETEIFFIWRIQIRDHGLQGTVKSKQVPRTYCIYMEDLKKTNNRTRKQTSLLH